MAKSPRQGRRREAPVPRRPQSKKMDPNTMFRIPAVVYGLVRPGAGTQLMVAKLSSPPWSRCSGSMPPFHGAKRGCVGSTSPRSRQMRMYCAHTT